MPPTWTRPRCPDGQHNLISLPSIGSDWCADGVVQFGEVTGPQSARYLTNNGIQRALVLGCPHCDCNHPCQLASIFFLDTCAYGYNLRTDCVHRSLWGRTYILCSFLRVLKVIYLVGDCSTAAPPAKS
ncbi:hypothetical protein BDR07DRAFT_1387977 [Suillus spraguei]|nr:hypothetical protein BDR07DRAFT_1387977 [Suillus spraguei]